MAVKKVSQIHDKKHDPMRAALPQWDGHLLNESYKMPAPNKSGKNDSYQNPVKPMKNTY